MTCQALCWLWKDKQQQKQTNKSSLGKCDSLPCSLKSQYVKLVCLRTTHRHLSALWNYMPLAVCLIQVIKSCLFLMLSYMCLNLDSAFAHYQQFMTWRLHHQQSIHILIKINKQQSVFITSFMVLNYLLIVCKMMYFCFILRIGQIKNLNCPSWWTCK